MSIDWGKAFAPLLKQYGTRKHPLDYHDRYQLVMMVILSSQDSNAHINGIAPGLFQAFPDLRSLAEATPEDLYPHMGEVRSSRKKARWMISIAQEHTDGELPHTMADLVKLPGVGRKSANVIIRESGDPAEGVVVDRHVLRVAPRIGVATGTDADKIEKALMEHIPQKHWNEVGMAISFLGRELCRPTRPKCDECPMRPHCAYYREQVEAKA